MENYVHRTEGLGAWVLITRIWYYPDFAANERTKSMGDGFLI